MNNEQIQHLRRIEDVTRACVEMKMPKDLKNEVMIYIKKNYHSFKQQNETRAFLKLIPKSY